ncbi:E3 ubiquitin-protein ligase RNF185-like [Anopheles ziemanni]|uniref:E3 ubiquitin-protein ligase RNF185-like n=1 Tax=Anopheles coustani TaxID=139045 RepID=UPI0026580BE4|nr:E3 ubiquitin-protein ligase RNF185-like [Anopheles coustani]XP_058124840.1 E3 ubiquitin-protein ligase RNF185-like [Anopheles coustani]XP_058124841.1 E3 ubiquitin-protein ligase RNF185-like [Anopheles coustani]XP_058171989.1 E3 ubiquitin-protein ligase RNF185-like [Anopheles ziemanni]
MASTTEIPPTVDTTPSAPVLDSLNRDAPAASTSSSAMTSTIDSGKPSTSYAFSFVGSNATPSSSTDNNSTAHSNQQQPAPNDPSEPDSGKPKAATTQENGTEGPGSSSSTTGDDGAGDEEKKDDSMFECNICLDTAKDAVVSMCGHLFCWPCIHQWMNGYRNTCPVCKSSISKEKVIPLYGRGGSKEDPRKTVPPRPAGQRTEPEHPTGFQGFTGDSFHMSFGIGAFPFGFFSSTLNFGANYAPGGGAAPRDNTRESDEDQFLSQVFLYVALVFLAWLAMA